MSFKTKFFRMSKFNSSYAKHTSYFLSESVFANKTGINHIIDGNGNDHKDDDATLFIKEHFENFFKKPATSPNADSNTIPEFLKNIPIENVKKIPREVFEKYESKISPEEVDHVIYKNHNGSAPGLSGISYQLVKALYPPLRPLIIKFVNDTIDKNSLSPFLRNRKVIFIPKPGKPSTDISSLRPICLLEIPYKIISAAVAERLKRLSSHILTSHQNAYISNSNIANCSRTILDFRTLARKENLALAIIGLDFSSAFDMISHSYCFETMRFFGFPDDLINKIKTLLFNPMISLLINDEITQPFQQAAVGSGQGDNVSAFLFCISIQPLLLKLAYDPSIKRFEHSYNDIDNSNVKIIGEPVGYADDVHVFLDPNNPQNLRNLLDALSDFSNISNLKLWLLLNQLCLLALPIKLRVL